MKNCFKFIYIGLLIIILQSCTAYRIIDSGYDANSGFSKYKSFSWLPVIDTTNSRYDNKKFREAIINDFTKQIIIKKYVLELDTPDFYLDLNISYNNQTRDEDYIVPQYHSYVYYTHPKYYPETYATKTAYYVENYITINMIDRRTNQLISSVTSEADIDSGAEIPDTFNSITRNILRKFLKMKKYAASSN
jgi:hypothetical protein